MLGNALAGDDQGGLRPAEGGWALPDWAVRIGRNQKERSQGDNVFDRKRRKEMGERDEKGIGVSPGKNRREKGKKKKKGNIKGSERERERGGRWRKRKKRKRKKRKRERFVLTLESV
jgi:hypothetical protein